VSLTVITCPLTSLDTWFRISNFSSTHSGGYFPIIHSLQLASVLTCLLVLIDLLLSSMLVVLTGVRQASLVCGPDEARNSDPRLGLIAGLYQDGGT